MYSFTIAKNLNLTKYSSIGKRINNYWYIQSHEWISKSFFKNVIWHIVTKKHISGYLGPGVEKGHMAEGPRGTFEGNRYILSWSWQWFSECVHLSELTELHFKLIKFIVHKSQLNKVDFWNIRRKEGMQNVTIQYNYITNVWNNLTERDGGKSAGLSTFENECTS